MDLINACMLMIPKVHCSCMHDTSCFLLRVMPSNGKNCSASNRRTIKFILIHAILIMLLLLDLGT